MNSKPHSIYQIQKINSKDMCYKELFVAHLTFTVYFICMYSIFSIIGLYEKTKSGVSFKSLFFLYLNLKVWVFKKSFHHLLKFIYSEKATKFCEIFTLLLTDTTQDKSKVKISKILWPLRIYKLYIKGLLYQDVDTLQRKFLNQEI